MSKMTSRMRILRRCQNSADSDYVCVIWFLGHQRFCKRNINAKFKHNFNSDYSITVSIIWQLPSRPHWISVPPPPAHANLFRMTEWVFQFLSGAIKELNWTEKLWPHREASLFKKMCNFFIFEDCQLWVGLDGSKFCIMGVTSNLWGISRGKISAHSKR